MPSWCLRKVRPLRFGSPRRELWYIACWGPIFAYVVVCCFHASPSAGWWNEAASSPKWSRNSPGRIPAFGRTTSTGTRSPWRGSSFVWLRDCVRFRMSWASWSLREWSTLSFPHCSPFLLAQAVNHTEDTPTRCAITMKTLESKEKVKQLNNN